MQSRCSGRFRAHPSAVDRGGNGATRDSYTAALANVGKAIVLSVRAGALGATGQPFFLTSNGVWLTDQVAPEYLLGL